MLDGMRSGDVTVRVFLALLAAPCAAVLAQSDTGFETGTSLPASWEARGVTAVLDREVAYEGAQSLRLTREVSSGRGGRVTQRVPAMQLRGDRFALRAYIRTEHVENGTAGLWLRIDGKNGRLYFDGLRERGPHGTSGWTLYSLEAPLIDEAETITLGLELDGTGTAWFDDVKLEPIRLEGRPAPSPAAAHYLDYALDLMQQSSIMRGRIDWTEFRARTLAQARGATTPRDTHIALRFALANLGDGHSYLATPERTAALETTPVSNARTGRPLEPPSAMRLDERVGYLSLPGFAGGTQRQQAAFAEQLHAALAELDRGAHCGVIVDLRDNTGGNLWPMLAGIGPLLGDGPAGAAHRADGSEQIFWYREGRVGLGDYVQLRLFGPVYRPRVAAPPVAVLIGPRTASSAEVVAGALRARSGTALFGRPTRGLSTGNRTFPLADGAALVLTVASTSDRHGRIYTGPLEPDVPAEPASREPLPNQPAVRAALAWLHGQPGCGAGERLSRR